MSAPPSSRTRPGRAGSRRQPGPTRPLGPAPRGRSRYLRGGGAQRREGTGDTGGCRGYRGSLLTTWPPAVAAPAPGAPAAPPWRGRAGRCLPALPVPAAGSAPLPSPPPPLPLPLGDASRKLRAPLPAPSRRAKMAPLDLDKYVEIARLCKYLPENDLKVRPPGRGGHWERERGGHRAGAAAGTGHRGLVAPPLLTEPAVPRSGCVTTCVTCCWRSPTCSPSARPSRCAATSTAR